MTPDELLQRWSDGSITTDELRELTEKLAEPQHQSTLLDDWLLESSLPDRLPAASVSHLPRAQRRMRLLNVMEPPKTSGRAGGLARHLAAAAAVLLAGLGIWWLRHRDDSFARITETQSAQWESSTLLTEPGSELGRGRLRLAEGLVTLRFARGAELTLEGPAELELLGAQLCRLHRGSLVAHVPQTAHGFAVLTPTATLIDHGTDFGISSDAIGNARVHVMQGAVELRHSNGTPPVRLTTHEMAEITPESVSPALPLEAEPRKPVSEGEADSFTAEITTLDGAGAARYVSEPRTGGHQSGTLLLLKNCAEPGYGRKIVLRFDLKSLPQAIREARLILNLGPTGLGYASHGGDARVGVYALTEDAGDGWTPDGLSWDTQPAFHPEAGRVDESKTLRVGEFVVPRGMQTGTFIVQSARLKERLQADSNRLLTLLLVRENRIEESGGLVLGIAGNHHSVLPPPTLRVR